MNLIFREQQFVENKIGDSSSPFWEFEMVRTIAALFNSGGGTLRVGVDDHGNRVGVKEPLDYAADKSPLARVLHKYLDPVPPFDPIPTDSVIEVVVRDGVTSPCVLQRVLVEPKHPNDQTPPKKFPVGSVFVRRMNGAQVSSELPQNRSDWQTVLHLWEANRGITIQGQLIIQFCLLLNQWNPFDPQNTEITLWQAYCLAGVAGPLGRKKLEGGLKAIIDDMHLSSKRPSRQEQNREGSDYKQPFVRRLEQLCQELGLNPPG
jgi:hypothetical protein